MLYTSVWSMLILFFLSKNLFSTKSFRDTYFGILTLPSNKYLAMSSFRLTMRCSKKHANQKGINCTTASNNKLLKGNRGGFRMLSYPEKEEMRSCMDKWCPYFVCFQVQISDSLYPLVTKHFI
jgi:hypothetical protein